jgi:polyphosphate kinase
LEPSRIYYFRNGGDEEILEILLGSADLMPRNLDGRVEVLFPVKDARLREMIKQDILNVHLWDTEQARGLLPDGTNAYTRRDRLNR